MSQVMQLKVTPNAKRLTRRRLGQRFGECQFHTESDVGLLDDKVLDELGTAAVEATPIVWPIVEVASRSSTACLVLAVSLMGRRLRVIQPLRKRNGYKAWRLWHVELAPRVHSRKLGMLSHMFKVPFVSSQGVEAFLEISVKWLMDAGQ